MLPTDLWLQVHSLCSSFHCHQWWPSDVFQGDMRASDWHQHPWTFYNHMRAYNNNKCLFIATHTLYVLHNGWIGWLTIKISITPKEPTKCKKTAKHGNCKKPRKTQQLTKNTEYTASMFSWFSIVPNQNTLIHSHLRTWRVQCMTGYLQNNIKALQIVGFYMTISTVTSYVTRYANVKCGGFTELISGRKAVAMLTRTLCVTATHPGSW